MRSPGGTIRNAVIGVITRKLGRFSEIDNVAQAFEVVARRADSLDVRGEDLAGSG